MSEDSVPAALVERNTHRAAALRRFLRAAPFVLAAAALLAFVTLRVEFLIDDAFIAFRHARNWVEAGVPAFNTGVTPPVEGYSDFLWVALLAGLHALGVAIPASAEMLGLGAAVAALALFVGYARRREGLNGAPLFLAALLLATAPPFVVWASGGLETALFAALVLALHVALTGIQREVLAGLVGGAAALGVALVRVEGFLWVLVGLAAAALARGTTRGKRFPIALGVYLAGFVVFLLWRHGVYGEWLSNTASAKVGLTPERLARGAKCAASYLLVVVTPLVALAATPVLLARGARREATRASAFVLAAFLGYTVLVGGDWMPFWRFLAPATPFVALLVGRMLMLLPRGPQLFVGAGLVAVQVLPLFDAALAPRAWLAALSFRDFRGGWQSEWRRHELARENGAQFERLGRALDRSTDPGEGLVFGAIGAVGWHAPTLFLHDRNGLVDREVAALGADDAAGVDTAGHDRRVPRAWFLARTEPHRPTYFHATLSEPGPRGEALAAGSPAFVEAVRAAMTSQVLSQPGEEPLLEHTVVEARPLPDGAGSPPGTTLLLWRRAESTEAARRFWAGIGLGARNGPR